MRLLNTTTYERVDVEEDLGRTPPYAILSHRWKGEEIKFRTFNAAALHGDALPGTNSAQRASASKIRGACQLARSQGYDYLWIDTVCINKDSSEELRRALNSMFAWYSEAAVCYTYLYDVSFSGVGDRMFLSVDEQRRESAQPSEWFERGWTLQELLAPRRMEFYDKDWKFMGTRHDLAGTVGSYAGIAPSYLSDSESRIQKIRGTSVATKMSWMGSRTTRDVEDIAYSLLGILNVNMTPMYGEGIKAFARLQETLLADSGSFDESLFAWKLPDNRDLKCYRKFVPRPGQPQTTIESIPKFEQSRWGLLAPSPDCFKATGDIIVDRNKVAPRLGTGFQRTHQGVYFELPVKETKNRWTGIDRKEISLVLNCWRSGDPIVIELSRDTQRAWTRTDCTRCDPKKGAKVGNNRVLGIDQGQALVGTITVAQPQVQLNYPD